MILFANGCSHTAAAEAVVAHAWAEDDGNLYMAGRGPHPLNLAASWCTVLGTDLGRQVICAAQSGGSNDRTIRTTKDWIENNPDKLHNTFMVIQWTSWEREEWFYQGQDYQVNASGWDTVHKDLQERYKHYVININWTEKTADAHRKIWELHCYLEQLGINHLFYNANSTFSDIALPNQKSWDKHYIDPYSLTGSYDAVLRYNGFDYVNPKTYHFGAKAHCFWANYVLQYIKDNQLLGPNEIPSD